MDKRKTDTKQKITFAALDLFARKGFTDTGIREIARAVGVKEPSVYNHFKSKGAILEHIITLFASVRKEFMPSEEMHTVFTKNSTVDDILSCMILYFPKEEEPYYLQAVHVLFQEQFRIEMIRDFVIENKFERNERYVAAIIKRLIEVGALDENVDTDFWVRMHTSVLYTFSCRYAMGVGEIYPHYKGYAQEEVMRKMYSELFNLHGVRERGGEA